MAYLTSFRNIQNLTLDLLGRSDATTRNRVINWINVAQDNFVNRELWPFRETTGTLNTVAGTQEYSLASNFSDMDQQNIISVALQGTVKRKLVYWPFNQLRADQPDYDLQGSDVPTRYYIKGGSIGFWPVPADAYTVLIDYYKNATELVNDSDESIIPLQYRKALMQYALSMEHDFDSDPDLAQKAMNEYEQIVTLARNNLLTQPNDTGNFQIQGPADAKSWTGLEGETR